jgi:pimeloyl-ACP methyl ester carboxylesterase
MATEPTIVLVHGAFADASGWNRVVAGLTDRGYRCYAAANPLRGVVGDAGYLRSFVDTIDGPVVLVGHSYGGCVITNAAVGAANVGALVYICAVAAEEGETVLEAFDLGGGRPSSASTSSAGRTRAPLTATSTATSRPSTSTGSSAPTSRPARRP